MLLFLWASKEKVIQKKLNVIDDFKRSATVSRNDSFNHSATVNRNDKFHADRLPLTKIFRGVAEFG